MKKKLLAIVLTVLIALTMCPTGALAAGTVHTVAAWNNPLLGSGMPGVGSGDTLVLPETAAAGTVLTVPAGITALTVQGRAVYTNLSIVLGTGHPGLTLTIQNLSMAASSGIDLSGAPASSLLLAGSNTIGSRIVAPEGMTLTIDGSGSLTAGAGIGGRNGYNGGTVVIFGGTITAQGEDGAAGIGGGAGPYRGADVIIWGGNITATGSDAGSEYADGGAGIGCGYGTGNPGTVTIHGGTIVATGRDGGAGIGGGYGHGHGGVVTINGGDITANGGDNGADDYGGAGIGSGSSSGAFTVAINGGIIRAYGGANAAGIGAGCSSRGVGITIADATIIAVGGSGIDKLNESPSASGGAGIGGAASSGNYPCSISNSTVTAQGGGGSAGIGSGFKSGGMTLTVSNSTITAIGGENGAGIGSGFYGGGVDLTVSSGRITATGGANAQDIGASLLAPERSDLHGGYGSLTINGWAIIIADDFPDPAGTNGQYSFRLFTRSGDPAGVQAVTVTAGDSSFAFTENTDAGGILGGIYLGADTDVSISVAGYYVKTTADAHFMPFLEHNSGAARVYERGFVYSASPGPAIGGAGVTRVPVRGATGVYTEETYELAPAAAYHVRAYAVTAGGTVYGEDRAFTTTDPDAPVYFNCSVGPISASGATLHADAWPQDGSKLTERGFVYGTAPNPTVTTGVLVRADMSVFSDYSAELTGLSAGVTYFVRAYAVGSTGTHYSAERFFTTDAASAPGPGDPAAVVTRGVLDANASYASLSGNVIIGESAFKELAIYLSETGEPTVPAVTTDAVTGVTSSGASLAGNVTSDGGATITGRGFVYGVAANPGIGGTGVTQITAGTGTGTFTATLTGLAANTPYHVRAYATNSAGTAYGADVSFTTLVTAISETPDDALLVFPNPTGGITRISVPGDAPVGRVEVFGVSGQMTAVFDCPEGNVVDLSALKTGVYVLKFVAGGKVYTGKVVKK